MNKKLLLVLCAVGIYSYGAVAYDTTPTTPPAGWTKMFDITPTSGGGCSPTITLNKVTDSTDSHYGCNKLTVTDQEWNGTQCAPKSGSGTSQYICDGRPGTGLNYKGAIESCNQLPPAANATMGDFWVVGGNKMCVFGENGWPTNCPDDCTPLATQLNAESWIDGTYHTPTFNTPGWLAWTLTIGDETYEIYDHNPDRCGDIFWSSTEDTYRYYNGDVATGALRKCEVQEIPVGISKPGFSTYYISAANEPTCSIAGFRPATNSYVAPTDQVPGTCSMSPNTNAAKLDCFEKPGYMMSGYTTSCDSDAKAEIGVPTKYDDCTFDRYVYVQDGKTYQNSLCRYGDGRTWSGGSPREYILRELLPRDPDTILVYHATNGVEPGFVAKHKRIWVDGVSTIGDQIPGWTRPDTCGTQSKELLNDRSLLVPVGDRQCTVQKSQGDASINYQTDYNPEPRYWANAKYTIAAGSTQCYTSTVGEYQEPTMTNGSSSCGTTIDNPCTNKGYMTTTYAYPGGGSNPPSGCDTKPNDKTEYDKCDELASIGNRTAQSDQSSVVYKCKYSGGTHSSSTYYWKGVGSKVVHPTTLRIHHAPTGCDTNRENCTARGYYAYHEVAVAADADNSNEVRGTRQQDECKPAIPNATTGGTKMGLKCSVPAGLNGYSSFGGAGTEYYLGASTPVPCETESTEYTAPQSPVSGATNTYSELGKLTRIKRNNCTGASPITEEVDDPCDMVGFGGTDAAAYTEYECKPANGGDAYKYRKYGQSQIITSLKEKATKNYVDDAVANVKPDIRLDYDEDEGALQYCNAGDECYIGDEHDLDKWNDITLGALNGQDGCSVEVTDKNSTPELHDGTYSTTVTLTTKCPGVADKTDILYIPVGKDGKDGEDGENGLTPEMQQDGTRIQWRYQGESEWTPLIDVGLTSLCPGGTKIFETTNGTERTYELGCCTRLASDGGCDDNVE